MVVEFIKKQEKTKNKLKRENNKMKVFLTELDQNNYTKILIEPEN